MARRDTVCQRATRGWIHTGSLLGTSFSGGPCLEIASNGVRTRYRQSYHKFAHERFATAAADRHGAEQFAGIAAGVTWRT